MKNYITPNRIKFNIGSYYWLHFFGLPIGFFIISFIQLFFYFKSIPNKHTDYLLIISIWTILIGMGTYLFQLNKLHFKTFKLTKEKELFKIELKEILKKNNWQIEHDTQTFLQATYNGIFNLDMLTIRFKKHEIQWNIIHHPDSTNSIAALFSLNRQGKKIIEIIKASA